MTQRNDDIAEETPEEFEGIDPGLAQEIISLRIDVQEARDALDAGLAREASLTEECRTAEAATKDLQDTVDRGGADSIEATEQIARDLATNQECASALVLFREKTVPALKNRLEDLELVLSLREITAGLSGIISDNQARVKANALAADFTNQLKDLLIEFTDSDDKKHQMFRTVEASARTRDLNATTLERLTPGLMIDTRSGNHLKGFMVEGIIYDGHEYKESLSRILQRAFDQAFINAESDAQRHLQREADEAKTDEERDQEALDEQQQAEQAELAKAMLQVTPYQDTSVSQSAKPTATQQWGETIEGSTTALPVTRY